MATVFQKLNLEDQKTIFALGAPESFEAELQTLSGVEIVRAARGPREIEFFLAFVTKRAEIERFAKLLEKRAPGDPVVWFAYPKKTSKKYVCEFDRDSGWAPLGDVGFEGVRMVAIDEDWSALRLRRVEHIRKMTRASGRALTSQGRSRTANER